MPNSGNGRESNTTSIPIPSGGVDVAGIIAESQQSSSGNVLNNARDVRRSYEMERLDTESSYTEEMKSPDPNFIASASDANTSGVLRSTLSNGANAQIFSSDGIEGLHISGEENDKHPTLRFSIPIPQAGPRPTSSIHGSVYSAPGTFSISSRGCTSTAPSTAPSTCSLNESENSVNEKVAAGSVGSSTGNKGRNQNQNTSNTMQSKNSIAVQRDVTKVSPTTTSALVASLTSNTHQSSPNTLNDDNIDRIDSALLSALSDPREKYGLLRLEQTLVDFMNERSTGYIEVGGPNNSVVFGGQTGGRLASGSSNIGPCTQLGLSNIGENEGRIGKQTSFQRLCLHRLADRFNIVRESVSNASPGQASASFSVEEIRLPNQILSTGNGSTIPGLIRLVKVKSSRIPKNLLIDLDVSTYQRTCAETVSPRNGEPTFTSKERSDVRDLAENFATASIDNKSNITFVKRQTNQPRKKMMIMKRSNGSNGSLKSNNSNDAKAGGKKNRNNLRGKKLSDKEKAYAEARARIFNESFSDNGEILEKSNAEVTGFEGNSNTAFNPKLISASPSSSAAPSEIEEDSDPFARIANFQSNVSYETSEIEYDNFSPTASHQLATSSKNISSNKVTWRNRRQEENDPDFWRFNRNGGMHTQYPYTTSTSGQSYINTGVANAQTTGYSHNGMMTQQHHNPQVFYPSDTNSRNPFKANANTNGGNFSHGLSHQPDQQSQKYFSNHTQASGYYAQQQSQHHQLRQNYQTINPNKGNTFVSSSNSHSGIYSGSEGGRPSSSSNVARRDRNILYNMEEFPALR